MTPAMPRAKRIDLLLQAALTERHVRRPLLAELVDELVDAGQYPEAAQDLALGSNVTLELGGTVYDIVEENAVP